MDNRKVGRPKLADTSLKKKSLIISLVMLLVSIALLAGGLISLNILPKFYKLKGEVVCSSIPDYLQPKSESNPNGLHEYGFTDINFYNAVVMNGSYTRSGDKYGESYCNTITEDELATIRTFDASDLGIQSVNGIQYLTNITYFELDNNSISEIDLSKNLLLENFQLENNNLQGEMNLSEINLYNGAVNLANNNLTSVKLKGEEITNLYLYNNNLSDVLDLTNIKTGALYAQNNNISELKLGDQPNLIILAIYDNNLTEIDLSGAPNLRMLIIGNNPMFSTKYLLKNQEIEYQPVILNEQYEITTEISDESIISLSNNILEGLEVGTSTIKLSNGEIMSIDADMYRQYVNGENINMQAAMLDYLIKQEIKVYDVESDKYNIDTTKKEIDVKGEDINIEDIDLGLEGLTGVVEGDNYIIKDGDTIVDTYKLVNIKKYEVKPSDSDNKETTTKNNSNNVVTTTKKIKVNRKIVNNTKEEKETTTTNAIINKIIKTNKGTTTTKVVEKKNNNIRWIIWPILLIILIIGYITYKNNKNKDS